MRRLLCYLICSAVFPLPFIYRGGSHFYYWSPLDDVRADVSSSALQENETVGCMDCLARRIRLIPFVVDDAIRGSPQTSELRHPASGRSRSQGSPPVTGN